MSARSRVFATISLLTVVLLAGACGGDRGSEGQGPQPPARGDGATTQPAQHPTPPPPPRSISVSGPRLDNSTPDLSCAVIRNLEADVAVQIVSASFTNIGDQVVREDTHCPVSNGAGVALPTRSCVQGVTLPASDSFADGCRIGVAPKVAGAPWNQKPGVVTLTLQVACTNTTGVPCNELTGANAPAAGTTVLATWTEEVGLGLQPGSYPEPTYG